MECKLCWSFCFETLVTVLTSVPENARMRCSRSSVNAAFSLAESRKTPAMQACHLSSDELVFKKSGWTREVNKPSICSWTRKRHTPFKLTSTFSERTQVNLSSDRLVSDNINHTFNLQVEGGIDRQNIGTTLETHTYKDFSPPGFPLALFFGVTGDDATAFLSSLIQRAPGAVRHHSV